MSMMPLLAMVVLSLPQTGWIGAEIADGPGCALLPFVQDGGPAYRAGLRDADCVTAIDATAIRNAADLSSVVAKLAPGKSVSVSVMNGKDVRVVPVERTAKLDTAFCADRERIQSNVLAIDFAALQQQSIRRRGQLSVGEVRRFLQARGPATVYLADRCGDGPGRVIGEARDNERLIGTVVVHFNANLITEAAKREGLLEK